MNKRALIIGNGKSTDLLLKYQFQHIPKNIDTYGTTACYKYCKVLNWWPTFYVLSDPKVVLERKEILESLINNKNIPTKNYYLCKTLLKHNLCDDFSKVKYIQWNGSGPAALNIAIQKKYKKIGMIGMDHNYTWLKDKLKPINKGDNRHVFTETIEDHPSYFWKSYIEKGDVVSMSKTAEQPWDKPIKLHCKYTQDLINKAIAQKIEIIDFSDNLLKCPKSKGLNSFFDL